MLRGDRWKFKIFPSLKVVSILVNRAYPDGMPPYVAFHLGLNFLAKYHCSLICRIKKKFNFSSKTFAVMLIGRNSERSQRDASNEQYNIGFHGEIRKTAT